MGFLIENKAADDAVRRNVGMGGHYFDRDTLRWWGSRVHEGYDLGNGSTLVIMSNKDNQGSVCNGRRHYYLITVDAKGDVHNLTGEWKYDVSEETGYWMSLGTARTAAKRYQKSVFHPVTA